MAEVNNSLDTTNPQAMGSAGGRARAKKLSPEDRKRIAEKAADARWKIPEATHEGVLDLAGRPLTCAVLGDGRRVLDQRSFLQAIGRKGNPRTPTVFPNETEFFSAPSFLSADNLKPFIGEALSSTSAPIIFRMPGGGRAHGYEARLLPLVCDVYLAARTAGVLTNRQIHIAEACEMLVRSLAQVGIVALVDEATGYQEVRDRRALQAILDRFLRQEFAAWAKRFPDEFYKQIFKLRKWEWKGMKMNRPQCVAQYTKDIVYARLAPGILAELESRNPVTETGRRASEHHRWLTEDVGHPALAQHIHAVIGLMRASKDWTFFMRLLDRAFPKRGCSIQLDFDDLPAPPEPADGKQA